jgi:hypothetical protein
MGKLQPVLNTTFCYFVIVRANSYNLYDIARPELQSITGFV